MSAFSRICAPVGDPKGDFEVTSAMRTLFIAEVSANGQRRARITWARICHDDPHWAGTIAETLRVEANRWHSVSTSPMYEQSCERSGLGQPHGVAVQDAVGPATRTRGASSIAPTARSLHAITRHAGGPPPPVIDSAVAAGHLTVFSDNLCEFS